MLIHCTSSVRAAMVNSKQAIAMLLALLMFFVGMGQPANASMVRREAKDGRSANSSDDNARREIRGGKKKKEETQGRGGGSADSCGTQLVESNDFDLRFNKITEGPDSGVLPLGAHDYPLCPSTVNELRTTDAVSVIDYHNCDECDIPMDDLVKAAGGWPSHPSSNLAFWEELWEVINVQQRRVEGHPAASFLKLPKIWANYSVHEVAEAVHDEFPGTHHVELIKFLLKEGAQLDRNVLPSDCHVDFVRGAVALSELNTWSIATVSPHNFAMKWSAGRARPEEVVWWIYAHLSDQNNLVGAMGVPSLLVSHISQLNLTQPADFTAYPEGSPRHPSWPAMHSAASVASLWLCVVMDLTPEQVCEVRAVDYAVAYARTVAGVHYPQDNIAGLNIGQEVIARKLPNFLFEKYGADPTTVQLKIEKMRIDWDSYLGGSCF